MSVQVYSLLGETKEERKAFLDGARREIRIVRLFLRVLACYIKWKRSPFVKFGIISTPLFCLLDSRRNKYRRALSSMKNSWIDSRTCQKNPVVRKGKAWPLLRASKIIYFGEYDAVTLTMSYLKVLHGMVRQYSQINLS